MVVLRSFVRRLFVQALVSSIVMAGLQGAVRFGPGILSTAFPSIEARRSEPTHAARVKRSAEPAAFAQDRTHADIKAGRFAVWREREASAPKIAPERLASKESGTGLSDVMLFDRCRPGCESRDPLLAFNKPRAMQPASRPEPSAEPLDESVVSSVTVTHEVAPPSEGGLAAAARGGVSWARRVVGTAGGAIGW